jgi:hypothetical protein
MAATIAGAPPAWPARLSPRDVPVARASRFACSGVLLRTLRTTLADHADSAPELSGGRRGCCSRAIKRRRASRAEPSMSLPRKLRRNAVQK